MSSKSDQNSVSEIASLLNLAIDFALIPDKLEFRIGEVGDLLGIKTYVLRFWEMEFEGLKPFKARNKQRVYKRRDVQISFLIKHLLYEKRYSIEGARTAIKQAKAELRVIAELRTTAETKAAIKAEINAELLSTPHYVELNDFVERTMVRTDHAEALAKLHAVIDDVKILSAFLENY